MSDSLMRKHPMCEWFMCDRPMCGHPMTERLVCDRPMRDHPMCERSDRAYHKALLSWDIVEVNSIIQDQQAEVHENHTLSFYNLVLSMQEKQPQGRPELERETAQFLRLKIRNEDLEEGRARGDQLHGPSEDWCQQVIWGGRRGRELTKHWTAN